MKVPDATKSKNAASNTEVLMSGWTRGWRKERGGKEKYNPQTSHKQFIGGKRPDLAKNRYPPFRHSFVLFHFPLVVSTKNEMIIFLLGREIIPWTLHSHICKKYTCLHFCDEEKMIRSMPFRFEAISVFSRDIRQYRSEWHLLQLEGHCKI